MISLFINKSLVSSSRLISMMLPTTSKSLYSDTTLKEYLSKAASEKPDLLFCPGGSVGAENLSNCKELLEHLEECFAIESRERMIIPCVWYADENRFWAQDSIFYFGPFKDFDDYILAWIPADEVMDDYKDAKRAEREITFKAT